MSQVMRTQKTMQAALEESSIDGDQLLNRVNEQALISVHETLEGLLRDKFKVEDGARLSSLQSYQAVVGQSPLFTLLDEFKQLMETLDLKA